MQECVKVRVLSSVQREINSVGSECHPYKVEVNGSNPLFPTNVGVAQLVRALV